MTNAELIQKIKAEIERRMKELDEQIVDIYDSKAVLRKDELQKLLSFLSTLESEKPIIPDDLEEAAGEYSFNIPSKLFHLLSEDQQILWKKEIEQAYLAGAINEREKMMKEAVEGKIAERIQGKLYARCQVPKTMKAEFGDKVRIIVIPNTDEE